MRHRLEDLGRIAAMLDPLTDHELFKAASGYNKHKDDPYQSLRIYVEDEGIHLLMCHISELENKLLEVYEIARWGDEDAT